MARQLRIAQHGEERVVWCSKNLVHEERVDITKCDTCDYHASQEDSDGWLGCKWPKAITPPRLRHRPF